MSAKRAILAWSSGKDSAWALHVLRQQNDVEVVGLLTTINEQFERVAMHAVRANLLRAQADAAGLPLHVVSIPWPCSNDAYETAMSEATEGFVRDGIDAIAFGDLFLEDIRAYREEKLRGSGMEPLFPLWGSDTATLARRMIEAGLKARLTCVDPKRLAPSFAGREFDSAFLQELPDNVDPCGENGEFHSFAYAGPMFHRSLSIRSGVIVERDGFVFADLLAADDET